SPHQVTTSSSSTASLPCPVTMCTSPRPSAQAEIDSRDDTTGTAEPRAPSEHDRIGTATEVSRPLPDPDKAQAHKRRFTSAGSVRIDRGATPRARDRRFRRHEPPALGAHVGQTARRVTTTLSSFPVSARRILFGHTAFCHHQRLRNQTVGGQRTSPTPHQLKL